MEVKRRILIIDDAPMFRELESVFLARSGHVITAGSADEGLEIAAQERPDVIVTDLAMPGLRGDDLCRAVKADPDLRRIPVIIVTGSHDGVEHEAAVRAGADDVVEKPINRLSFIQSVNHFLRLAQRGLVRVPMETDVHLEGEEMNLWGRSRNVSRGGIYVELDRQGPEPSTELQLEFALPEIGTSLAPTAKVVWRQPPKEQAPYGVGLQFLKLDREAARFLEDYVYERVEPELLPSVPL